MTNYLPAPGVYVGRPPCSECGAAYHLHGPAHLSAAQRAAASVEGRLPCPSSWRPSHLEEALAQLRTANDPAAIFTARGEVQRLLGHRPGTCLPLCSACEALLVSGAPR